MVRPDHLWQPNLPWMVRPDQLWRGTTCGVTGHLARNLLAAGKWPRGCPQASSRGHSRSELNAQHQVIIPALTDSIRSKAAYTVGSVGNQNLDVLLDSGASFSVICKEYAPSKDVEPLISMKLVNADGSDLAPLGTLVLEGKVGDIQSNHPFIVVDHLSVPVILGCDFLTKHGVVVDFAHCTFSCFRKPKVNGKLMLSRTNSCMLVIDSDLPQAIPSKANVPEKDADLPTDYHPSLESVLQEHRAIFRSQL